MAYILDFLKTDFFKTPALRPLTAAFELVLAAITIADCRLGFRQTLRAEAFTLYILTFCSFHRSTDICSGVFVFKFILRQAIIRIINCRFSDWKFVLFIHWLVWIFNSQKIANMAYQLYRNTTLGNTLQESLDELIQVRFIFINLTHICSNL